ncbi:MAG: MBL fold metallo-hydrolase [Candidatus Geothermincolia bacterium]
MSRPEGSDELRITWLGHAMFLLEADGTRVVIDPYNEGPGYPLPQVEADMVLITHGHGDHANAELVRGRPLVVREPGQRTERGIELRAVPTWHDANQGVERGPNLAFAWSMAGIQLLHLGDLGHVPDDSLARELGSPDVLFIPVGGIFTIDAGEAARTISLLAPRLVIPMHYKTAACVFPIAGVEDFARLFSRVEVTGESTLRLKREDIPRETVIKILEYV